MNPARRHGKVRASHFSHERTCHLDSGRFQARFVIRAVLENAGYNVIEAADESDALAACEQPELRIALLISDVLLGEAYGTEVAIRLAALRPHMPILFISGCPIEDVHDYSSQASKEMASIAFLQKPFDPEQLLAKVRDLVPAVRRGSARTFKDAACGCPELTRRASLRFSGRPLTAHGF